MKPSLTIFALLLCVQSFAQKAFVKYRAGNSEEIQIKATSDSRLYVQGGSIHFQDLDSIAFESEKPGDAKLYENLLKAGVRVTTSGIPKYTESPVVVAQRVPLAGYQDDPFAKFEKQRATGKVLQLIGAAALSTSVFLMAKYRNDDIEAAKKLNLDYEPKKAPTALVIGGAAMFVIGISIDIEAGKHLKKR